ncbi:hypothetical protein CTKA_01770 [Chthonomonas calidirosea]|uniref:Uncharacterized protein n=2 Tax=Chthonomonas TaxID=1077265 RepID=S0EWG4_CHTCT|nr:hypothetical protein [Chthonomonas calidirosea]CCW36131.1 hypothetical protein CCALI_02326 [Chthonomonas calidirosea T49]CEK18246.1 hypothetical protein CTKA_01770 [Chthonomonas calidirosea]
MEETAGPKAMAVYHQSEAHNWNGPVPKVELVDPQKLGLLLGVLAGYYDFLQDNKALKQSAYVKRWYHLVNQTLEARYGDGSNKEAMR